MKMKQTSFTILSDIHETHNTLTIQPSDFLLMCGDIILRSESKDFSSKRKYLKTFGKWLQHLPVKQIVMILGNHERDYQIDSNTIFNSFPFLPNLSILNGWKTIDNFHFFGISFPFNKNIQNVHQMKKFKEMKDRKQSKPTILMTHEPPYEILDYGISNRKIISDSFYHAGNKNLKKIDEWFQPDLHCFGHCHSSHGIMKNSKTMFVNASVVDDMNDPFKKPIQLIYSNGKFIPTDWKKMYSLTQFKKQISLDPFEFITSSNDYKK